MNEKIILGKWSENTIGEIIAKASDVRAVGARISFLSSHFLGTPYQGSTLIGSPDTPEELVVNLAGFDCFTFIDQIEAMRLSQTFPDFLRRLKEVRYKGGMVTYKSRKHFFTDWIEYNGRLVKDVTRAIGGEDTRQTIKILNVGHDGEMLVPGIEPKARTFDYLPSTLIGQDVMEYFRDGDYVGIYSDMDGLDVSHVGIIVAEKKVVYLRHASSATDCHKVTDQLFADYIKGKTGAVVLRPV